MVRDLSKQQTNRLMGVFHAILFGGVVIANGIVAGSPAAVALGVVFAIVSYETFDWLGKQPSFPEVQDGD